METASLVVDKPGTNGAAENSVNCSTDVKAAMLMDLRRICADSIAAHERFAEESLPVLSDVAAALVTAIRNGNKILLFGNGGSVGMAR